MLLSYDHTAELKLK